MKKITLLILVCIARVHCMAADSLLVSLNKSSYVQGEKINWQCELKHYTRTENALTLQLWIENLQTAEVWQCRYPLINGYTEGTLNITSELPDGKYAFNFLLQGDFFNVKGTVKDINPRDTVVNYMIVSKDKKSILNKAYLNPMKSFEIRNFLFQDTALFIFSPQARRFEGELWVNLKTSLDSTFKPSASITRIVVVGAPDTFTRAKIAAVSEKDYHFNLAARQSKYLLPEVVIKSQKKLVDDFVKEHVSPMFQGVSDITFSGLDDPEIANSIDLFTFLQTKVAGLNIQINSETGAKELYWRNAPVAIYLNEFKMQPDDPLNVNPSDVAMIKVFKPGFEPGNISSAGGVVSVYTKIGSYDDNKGAHKNVFHIRGYDPLVADWKPTTGY